MKSSSSSNNSHVKQTRHLQRQSTANSSRNYYFGESRPRHRASSIHSSSSANSSLSDPKERMRKNGARSKDSGFRSPTTNNQQIYSISSKQKNKNRDFQEGRGAISSPTPTTGSLGHRSVKTTTTTLSAGLADRPGSRNTTKSDTKLLNKQQMDSYDKKTRGSSRDKVSKPPSPFQKIADWFNAPAKQRESQRKPMATRWFD